MADPLPLPSRYPLFAALRPAAVALGCISSLLLAGYTPPPLKLIERWVASENRSRATVPAVVPIRWSDRPGWLYAAGPGRSALAIDGHPPLLDPGPTSKHPSSAFWRAVDLFSVGTAEDLASSLEAAGLDLDRGGYARSAASRDDVAYTLGARGEGEPALPQVWLDRSPLWPRKVLLGEGGEVQIGPAGGHGWPQWFRLANECVIEITGPPSAASSPPPWVNSARAAGDLPYDEWRRVFGFPPR